MPKVMSAGPVSAAISMYVAQCNRKLSESRSLVRQGIPIPKKESVIIKRVSDEVLFRWPDIPCLMVRIW